MIIDIELQQTIRGDLQRLAQFAANMVEAFSSMILLPRNVLSAPSESPIAQAAAMRGDEMLELWASHSLSTALLKGCCVPVESGLIGWVAKHSRSIHVSPFDRDSRILGTYAEDQELKSFIGVPINLDFCGGESKVSGVLACDSKKSFAFSKIQGKLLHDLAIEISNALQLRLSLRPLAGERLTWAAFLKKAYELIEALGPGSIEVLRLRPRNFEALERSAGTKAALDVYEQIQRLIQQATPPHFPSFYMPNGDVVMVVDNMMTSYLKNKICSVCDHVAAKGHTINFEFMSASFAKERGEGFRLENVIARTAQAVALNPVQRGLEYGVGRA